MLSAIVLTFNSEKSIRRTLDALKQVSDDIYAVDSFSSDATVDILNSYGCHVVQRKFSNYSDQRNWAIDTLQLQHDWQIHVDADEELEAKLIQDIKTIDFAKAPYDGYIIGRKIVFLGKVLRFGGIARTWHYRIFREGFGRCEDRLYDQHFVGSGRIGRIQAFMLDHQEDTLAEWTARHNRWSDLESAEALAPGSEGGNKIQPRLGGNPIERARANKSLYYKLPLFLRPALYFGLRYVLLLGILDGREGLIYNVLQGFWFRFLVDAKIYEKRRKLSDQQ